VTRKSAPASRPSVEVLRRPRDRAALREIRAMRDKMRRTIKRHPAVRSETRPRRHRRRRIHRQYLVLGEAHRHAEPGNIGNLALKLAARLALIAEDTAMAAHAAIAFRRLQHQLRLQGERYARVEPASVAGHARAWSGLWEWVFSEQRV
jgi:glutamate-ammonia-ligase adenylyltransferase